MNAAQETAFDHRAAATAHALWPGNVRIGGTDYPCSLVREESAVQFREGDQAGLAQVKSIQVELRKSLHPTEPIPETVLVDLADSCLYKIKRIGGRGDSDTCWYLHCTIDD